MATVSQGGAARGAARPRQPARTLRHGDLAAGGRERDVGAVVPALQLDRVQRGVGPLARLREVRAERHHDRTRPPAATTVPSASEAVPAWMHVDAGGEPRRAPVDRVAGARRAPGSRAAATTTVTAWSSLQRSGPTSSRPPVGGGPQQLAERGAEPGEDDLGLGVAEAGVELDDPRARGRSGPGRRRARRRTGCRGGASRRPSAGRPAATHVVDQAGGGPVERRVGAHAAGVGAGRRRRRRA